jgi:hypothetical protein
MSSNDTSPEDVSAEGERLLYCHCAYAKVVPVDVKTEILRQLGASGRDFEAVPDLCEMSASKDPKLEELASCGKLTMVACYPRSVRWLFHAAGHQMNDQMRVLNMRESSAAELAEELGLAPQAANTEGNA